jgi:HD-GYP domain-containing protein (c-di-GMP phosphodiesterase class II)
VSDIFDALSAKRPYRDAMPLEKVFGIMRKDAPRALDAECLEALIAAGTHSESTSTSLLGLSRSLGNEDSKPKQEKNHETLAPVR